MASVGMWTWHAVDSSYFVLRAFVCAIKGDMLGSAKLSGWAGHSANYGDHFSLVKGASTINTGSKAQYYPISPPQKDKIIKSVMMLIQTTCHCKTRDISGTQFSGLNLQPQLMRKIRLLKSTGIAQLTISAASPAFLHPSFSPLDPFHLFYENCMVHIWDMWVKNSASDEKIHMDEEMVKGIGNAMETLPPSFSSPIQNPDTKCGSQYKVFEWMALLHLYILRIAWELGIDEEVLDNFAQFVNIVEVAMSHSSFINQYSDLYISDPWLPLWNLNIPSLFPSLSLAWCLQLQLAQGWWRCGWSCNCNIKIGEADQ